MRTDSPGPVVNAPPDRSGPTPTPTPRRLEVAQRVWQHSLELASSGEQRELSDQALALLRTARHDADTMVHALGLGRSQTRHPSNDEAARRGVQLLVRIITYLGVKSKPRESPSHAD